jgi:hypothetical protein
LLGSILSDPDGKLTKNSDIAAKAQQGYDKCLRRLYVGGRLKRRLALPLWAWLLNTIAAAGVEDEDAVAEGAGRRPERRQQTPEQRAEDLEGLIWQMCNKLRLLAIALGPKYRAVVEHYLGPLARGGDRQLIRQQLKMCNPFDETL